MWLELTTLLIPGENDTPQELEALTRWVVEHLGPDVPLHFTAFHPDWKMRDKPPTPGKTLTLARDIAVENGMRFVYTGNVHDAAGGSTWCPSCGNLLIERDWYRLGEWNLDGQACCTACGARCPGLFEATPGHWGARRQPVAITRALA